MNRDLALIANDLLAEGFDFDAEQTGGNCYALVTYLADDSVIAVTEECVAVYPTVDAWNSDRGQDPVVVTEGILTRADIVAAVQESFTRRNSGPVGE